MPGLGLGLGLGVGRSVGVPFTPLSLAGFNSGVFPALAVAGGGLWQNAGKTTLADADSELVRVATCPFAGVDYTAASDSARCTLKNSGALWWLEFDGTDDALLRTVSLPQPYWFFSASRIGSAGGTIHDGHATNTGYTARGAGAGAAAYQMYATSGDLLSSNTLLPNVTALFGGVFDGASSALYLNGTKSTNGSSIAATDLTGVTVGSRSGFPSEKCDKLYAWCCGTGTPSDADFERLRLYFAGFAP